MTFLPTKLPVYLNSMAYMFGVLTLCSLAMIIASGMVMAFFGPNWYHVAPPANSSIRCIFGRFSSSSPS